MTTFREQPKKTWSEVIRNNLKESKVSKDLVKDRNTWKSSMQTCKLGKQALKRVRRL